MARVLFLKADPKTILRRISGEPSKAQAEAGNYKKGTIHWRGMRIRIENPAGSIRRHANGYTRMLFPYGYLSRTMGTDGDEVDVFVGPQLKEAEHVYVVAQRVKDDWKKHDEDKVMLGFASQSEAKRVYLAHYDDPRFFGDITPMKVDDFLHRVKSRNGKKL